MITEQTQSPPSHGLRKVCFLNLHKLYRTHQQEILEAIHSVLDNASFIGGGVVERFETDFARWVNPEMVATGCGNGTDALTLAFKALGCAPGSEAILPAMTFVATAEAAINAGFTLRLVDVEPKTWLMDPGALKKAISPKTRLVVPVHLYGQMARMDEIAGIARDTGCTIIEDAAQAHGARWKGHSVGHYGHAATFSFFPGKNLGAFGDGGAIVARDSKFIERCSMAGKHGGLKKYEHNFVGACSRLDAVQAAVLSVKLKYIDLWTENRRKVATWYREYLSGIPGLSLPVGREEARHVYHLFVIESADRHGLQQHLTQQGIETGIHYPKAIHEQEAFKSLELGQFPQASHIASRGLSLP